MIEISVLTSFIEFITSSKDSSVNQQSKKNIRELDTKRIIPCHIMQI